MLMQSDCSELLTLLLLRSEVVYEVTHISSVYWILCEVKSDADARSAALTESVNYLDPVYNKIKSDVSNTVNEFLGTVFNTCIHNLITLSTMFLLFKTYSIM